MARLRRALPADDGFTLIEMVAAMTIAALVLTAGAAILGSSLKTIVAARANSQSAELVSEKIEKLRALDYASIAMDPSDLTGDSNLGGTPDVPTFDPDGSGSLGAEDLVLSAGGAVAPHVESTTRNAQQYTLATYVTQPPLDSAVATAAYKRITVVATWTTGGLTHTRQSSTYVTMTRRGLPLPSFQLTASAGITSSSAITVNAGAQLVLPFSVVNRGARDAFNLTISGTPTMDATFAFKNDVGGSKTYESGTDTAASDSDLDGTPDTGQMDTDATATMLAVTTVPSAAVGGSYVFTLQGVSAGQPDATSSTRTASFHVTVVNDSLCSGCTYVGYYFLNQYPACVTAPCNTTAQTNMPMRSIASTASSLPNFDTNVDSGPGRAVARALSTPAYNSTTSSSMANWRYTVSQNTTLKGGKNVLVDVYVAVSGVGSTPGTGLPVTLKAYVNRSTNGSGATSNIGSATATLPAQLSSGFVKVRIYVPVAADTTVSNNRFLEVKVVVDSASSTTGAWLAYDATPYPSIAWFPVV